MSRCEHPKIHNGFVLTYSGPIFHPSSSNAITQKWFMTRGGSANQRQMRVTDAFGLTTYYDVSLP